MRLPKLRYAMLFAVIVGGGFPLVLLAAFWLKLLDGGDWLIYVWPSAFMLMATETLGHSVEAFEVIGLSIAYDVILYAIVVLFVWCGCWATQAWRKSLRDGTTI